MPWAVAAAAVGAGISATAGGGDSVAGGAGSNIQKREPWDAAAPWLKQNLMGGQLLQNSYGAKPFSETQQQAYGNQFANSNYMRQLMNTVNTQAGQNQPFNRGNPTAVPRRYQLPNSSQSNMGMGGFYGATVPGTNTPAAASSATQSLFKGGVNATASETPQNPTLDQFNTQIQANLDAYIRQQLLDRLAAEQGQGNDGDGGG